MMNNPHESPPSWCWTWWWSWVLDSIGWLLLISWSYCCYHRVCYHTGQLHSLLYRTRSIDKPNGYQNRKMIYALLEDRINLSTWQLVSWSQGKCTFEKVWATDILQAVSHPPEVIVFWRSKGLFQRVKLLHCCCYKVNRNPLKTIHSNKSSL